MFVRQTLPPHPPYQRPRDRHSLAVGIAQPCTASSFENINCTGVMRGCDRRLCELELVGPQIIQPDADR